MASTTAYRTAKRDAEHACRARLDVRGHLVERYARAIEREYEVRAAWAKEGSPIFAEGGKTGRSTVAHPAVAVIEQAEAHAQRLAVDLGLVPGRRAGARGRPQEQVVPRGTVEPPRLRAVRSTSTGPGDPA